jgi:hypothetical protein
VIATAYAVATKLRTNRPSAARQADSNPRAIHLWAARQVGAGRRDAAGRLVETGPMKKRLLISALVFAALLLALYGVMFGTGAK